MALRFGAPSKGILQGLNPAASTFPPNAAPTLVNYRVQRAEWQTRKGQDPAAIVPGVGRTRLLFSVYWDAERLRLGARGDLDAVGLYDLLEGTDAVYQPVLDAAGDFVDDLAGNPIHALNLFQFAYLTDQATELRAYSPETRLCNPVRNLPTPTVAPNVQKTWYGFFERWDGAAPYGWYESNNTELRFVAPGANEPDFELEEGGTTRLRSDSGAKGEFVSKNTTSPPTPLGIAIPTAALALWMQQTVSRAILQVQFGGMKKNQIQYTIDPPQKDTAYVFFMPTQGLQTCDYFRIKNVLAQTEVRNLFLSSIIICGNLLGKKQYRYTYYRPSTEQESSPSPVGPNAPLEFTEGINNNNATWVAAQRCAAVIPTANPVRQTDDEIRVWVNGGTAALTSDGLGEPVWTLAGKILDFDTLLNGAVLAAATSLTVDNGTPFEPATSGGITTYQWGVIDFGNATQEFFRVTASAANVLTLADPLQSGHADNATVQLIFLDNTTNTELASELTTLDLERDNPPPGAKWVVATPDGRMLAFNFLEDRDGDDVFEYRRSLGMAVSNKPTPLRRRDQEIFPINPDPYTTNSATQGFRTDLLVDDSGDEIMWAGLFNGLVTVITRQKVIIVTSYSQANWSSGSIRKVLDRGCIAPNTVQEINGLLVWASDGPSIIGWDGHQVRDLSDLKVAGEGTTYLGNAPAGYEADAAVLTVAQPDYYWQQWFAVAHAVGSSIYYRLAMIPDDPLVARLTDLTLVSATTVSSAMHPFTSADLGRGLQIPSLPVQLGWFPGLYRIDSVAGGIATLDRAIGAYGYGYPYSTGNAALWEPFNSQWLDYDVLHDLWEPRVHYWDSDADGIGDKALGWDTAEVQAGAGDNRSLFAAEWNPSEGDVWQQEVGLLDGEVPIKTDAKTPRLYLTEGTVAKVGQTLLRLLREAGECDELFVEITMGGSDYPERTLCVPANLQMQKGPGDQEIFIPWTTGLLPEGRWVQFRMHGDVSTRPAVREITTVPVVIREEHIGGAN